jgi:hypothetical protein
LPGNIVFSLELRFIPVRDLALDIIKSMITEILGGGSFKNKAWVDELRRDA